MSSKLALIAAILAVAEARFGQEQLPVAAVQALTNRGAPGAAGTLSGQVPGTLLGAANPCDKLSLADDIVAQLGDFDDVLLAAIGLVAAEQNFNPFAVNIPNICGDASLPATEALRGIVPLVDPAVGGSDVENANSATSVAAPFNAAGLSVAEVMIAQGFANFSVNGVDQSAAAGAAAGAGAAAAGAANNAGAGAGAAAAGAAANNNAAANVGNANAGQQASNVAGADFGKCVPTIDFVLGRPGRKADEGTFLPVDALVAQGQQDALNPNIITNRVCDQLTNVCEANDAAKALCEDAQAQIEALGTRDATTAQAFNSLLGF